MAQRAQAAATDDVIDLDFGQDEFVLDLSDQEPESPFALAEPGVYLATIEDVEAKPGPSGTYFNLTIRLENDKMVWDTLSLAVNPPMTKAGKPHPKAGKLMWAWKIAAYLDAAGIDRSKPINLLQVLPTLRGRQIGVEVAEDTYNKVDPNTGKGTPTAKNVVKKVMTPEEATRLKLEEEQGVFA